MDYAIAAFSIRFAKFYMNNEKSSICCEKNLLWIFEQCKGRRSAAQGSKNVNIEWKINVFLKFH